MHQNACSRDDTAARRSAVQIECYPTRGWLLLFPLSHLVLLLLLLVVVVVVVV